MSILQAIEAEQRLRNLIAWSDLGNTIAKYEGKHHSLRVDIQLNNVMYCGQQYAGAPNYHDAPKWLFDKIIAELQTGVGEGDGGDWTPTQWFYTDPQRKAPNLRLTVSGNRRPWRPGPHSAARPRRTG